MAPEVLRPRTDAASPPVTNLELFFDLVYVFAITQLSEFVFDDHSARGALEALILFVAVWWGWNYTAWATNWVDPRHRLTATIIIVMMAVGLVMSAALPRAFGSRGLPFAVAYVSLQLLRTGFVAWAFPSGDVMRSNNLRLLSWLAIGGAFWIGGACLHGEGRLIVWSAAVVVELAAPLHGFWLPGAGATPIERWRLTGTHLAERYQLVLIIAFGESVLRVGATFSEQSGSASVDAAFVVGFLISAALWAAYFLRHAESGAQIVATSGQAARIGRSGYAYAHAVMVAGVIVVAVAIRETIDGPGEASSVASAITMLGGPALYLAGLALFERFAHLGDPRRPGLALLVLAALTGVASAGADRLLLSVCVAAVCLTLAVAASRPARGPLP